MPPIKGSLISQDESNSRKFSNFGPLTIYIHGAIINKSNTCGRLVSKLWEGKPTFAIPFRSQYTVASIR